MPPPPDSERERLAQRYREMTEVELQDLAEDTSSLTDVARDELRAEISRRGLSITIAEASAEASPAAPVANPERSPQLPIVRVFRDLPEAWLARSVLDSGGIQCFLFDENIVRLDWFWSNAVGGVKLRVREEDANDAVQLLDQPRPEKFMVGGVGEYIQPRCPACQSLDVAFRELVKRLVYAYFYVGLPVPLTRLGWKCHSCGHEWPYDPQTPP